MLKDIIMMFGDWIIRVYCAGGYIAVFAALAGIVTVPVMICGGVEKIYWKNTEREES